MVASNAMTWPRERRSGGIETKPGAAPGEDLHGGEPGARGAAPSAPARPPSRPDPRSGRPRAGLFRLLPVLALLLAALSPFAAAPAAADVLVSNIGQTAGADNAWSVTTPRYQGFTTGSNSAGYTLESIEVKVHVASTLTPQQIAAVTAELWSATSTGLPDAKLADLTVPSSIASGNVTFTAPANTTLMASTKYFVRVFGSGVLDLKLVRTSSDAEDSGAAAGWSIENIGRHYSAQLSSWRTSALAYNIRVNGSAVQTASTPAAPTNLNVRPGDRLLSLTWTAPSGTVTGYDVHYTSAPTTGNGSVANSATASGNDPSAAWVDAQHSDTDTNLSISRLTNGTLYRVRVRAKNANGAGAWGFASGTPQVPTAPTNLVVTPGDSELRLSWTAATGLISGYELDYTSAAVGTVANNAAASGSDPAADWVAARSSLSSSTTSFTLGTTHGVTNGTRYRVRVRAIYFAAGSSTYTAYAFGAGTPQAPTQTPPTGVTITPGDAQLRVSWTVPSGNIGGFDLNFTSSTSVADDAAASGADPAAGWIEVLSPPGPTDTSYTIDSDDATLANGTPYRVRIRATGPPDSAWVFSSGTPGSAVQPTATTAFSATMTVGDGGSWKGFRASSNTGALSDDDFTSAGVSYRILSLRLTNSGWLGMRLDKALPSEGGLVLNVGGTRFRFVEAVLSWGPGSEGVTAGWFYSNQGDTPPSWSVGDTVAVSFGVSASSTVKLAVRPNPVREGSWVSVEACLSALPQGRTRIPVTLSHGTSETGDWGVSQSGHTDGSLPILTAYSITIADWFQSRCGTVNIPTHRDSDHDDETFTVAVNAAGLPPGVQAGSPVAVTIQDLQDWPEVSLRAVRRAVAEGSPVELQAVLTKPLAKDVVIPLRLRGVTAERPDYGSITSITIAAGSTTGSGTIDTSRDDDTDDERFDVAVVIRDLPSGVAPGTPSDVGIRIVDGANARLRALDLSGN